jgi:hypothetical protein
MGNIFIDYDIGIPQIKCTDCGKCDSIIGRSLCSVTDRGCCHYFPEFTLVDIQRMAILEGGKEALELILSCPGTTVNNFNLYSKGYFDKAAYDQYISSGNLLKTGSIRDHTIFFRCCPFVEPGKGCKLPPRFRTTVCNFFVCAEILERPDLQDFFTEYLEERSRYSRWVYRESAVLAHILTENGLNLVSGFDAAIELLAHVEQNNYDFPELEPVNYSMISLD